MRKVVRPSIVVFTQLTQIVHNDHPAGNLSIRRFYSTRRRAKLAAEKQFGKKLEWISRRNDLEPDNRHDYAEIDQHTQVGVFKQEIEPVIIEW